MYIDIHPNSKTKISLSFEYSKYFYFKICRDDCLIFGKYILLGGGGAPL